MKEQLLAKPGLTKESMLATLENSQTYTLAVAEAMPENMYGSRPSDNVWDFRELLHHVAYGIQWWEDNYIKGNKTDWDPPAVKKSKSEVVLYLKKAYSSLRQTIETASVDEDKIKGFYATLDHITHHRGQAVTYLRFKGITPPDYMY